MIKHYEKFRIQSLGDNSRDFFAEVNWNPNDDSTNESKVIKFLFPDTSESYVKREHLMSILFAIGREEDQRNLVPIKLTKNRWYETVLAVKAIKDVRKGENLTFPIKISLPDMTDEIIGPQKKSSGLLIPNNNV